LAAAAPTTAHGEMRSGGWDDDRPGACGTGRKWRFLLRLCVTTKMIRIRGRGGRRCLMLCLVYGLMQNESGLGVGLVGV